MFADLASPTSGPICQIPKSGGDVAMSGFQVIALSRRLSDKRKNSEVEDRRPPAITTTVELSVPAVVEF